MRIETATVQCTSDGTRGGKIRNPIMRLGAVAMVPLMVGLWAAQAHADSATQPSSSKTAQIQVAGSTMTENKGGSRTSATATATAHAKSTSGDEGSCEVRADAKSRAQVGDKVVEREDHDEKSASTGECSASATAGAKAQTNDND